MGRRAGAAIGATALWLGLAFPLAAQQLATPPVAPPADVPGAPAPESDDQMSFAADTLDYDDDANLVTATGDVRLLRAGSRLRADKVVWNRATGEVRASGNVAAINPGGDTVYADSTVLQDNLRDGVVENVLLVLADGGRLAGRHGVREGQRAVLDDAAYTPCPVTGPDCRPHEPSWKITAIKVIHDGDKHRIYYEDARISIFGLPLLWLPRFSHPDGSDTGGGTGLLLPDIELGSRNGLELAMPYYWQIAPNRDLTITPHVYSKVLPAIEGQYRSLDSLGAFRLRAMATYGSRLPATYDVGADQGANSFRGFVDGNGRYQLGADWTLSGQLRLASDRTFMKRYNISNDDRLRSTLSADRLDDNSALSIAGWFVQTLRTGDSQGQQPIALPAIDYRRRVADPLLGGLIQLQLNSLALIRTAGQDTQRAFAGVRWDLRRLTRWGQELTLTAYARADLYHTDEIDRTTTLVYRGNDGWSHRGIATMAADLRWPLVGTLLGGSQQIVPRVQVVASPQIRNLAIPDEDSRAVDLEDTNLFSLNRFSGYDRYEDGSRVTYGLEWNYQRPRFDLRTIVGQSYRLVDKPTILPSGTGLSDRFSDIVGRVVARYGAWLEITERFRLDKDSLHIRRNEIDAAIGPRNTYLLIGYLRLNRNIDTSIEDLRDREEVRVGGRIQFARHWSLFGSTVIDLTSKSEDPTSLSDGFQPVRDRLGVEYDDECLSLGLTWRRDYDPTGDARRGSTFSLRLALRNVGR